MLHIKRRFRNRVGHPRELRIQIETAAVEQDGPPTAVVPVALSQRGDDDPGRNAHLLRRARRPSKGIDAIRFGPPSALVDALVGRAPRGGAR